MFSTSSNAKRSGTPKARATKRTAQETHAAEEAASPYPLIAPKSTEWLGAARELKERAGLSMNLSLAGYEARDIRFLGLHNDAAYFCVMCLNADHSNYSLAAIVKQPRHGGTCFTFLKRTDAADFACDPKELSVFFVRGSRPKPILAFTIRGRADRARPPMVLLYTLSGKLIKEPAVTGPPPADLTRGTTSHYTAQTYDGFIVLEPGMFSPELRRTLISAVTFARLRELGPAIEPAATQTLMQTATGVVVAPVYSSEATATYWSPDASVAAAVTNSGKTITIYDTASLTKLREIETPEEWAHVAVAFMQDGALAVVRVSKGGRVESSIYA